MIMFKKFLASIFILFAPCILIAQRIPRLTIVLVVDQLSHNKLMELKPYLTGGLHHVVEHGVVYHDAHQPHAGTATATGHTTLASGTTASIHGITGNDWFNQEGKSVDCDYDTKEHAAVIAPHGTYDYGKSSRNVMVDTITDQFIAAAQPYANHCSYSISLKSRSAICTAGKLGKALWFDNQSGRITSSKAYFDALPQWVNRFNETKKINTLTTITWERAFMKRDYPYRMFSQEPATIPLFGKTIAIDRTHKEPYEHFVQTPQANRLLFELARICIDEHTSKNNNDKMLLWLCPSSLDAIGHEFGPHSVQATDMIYHIDLELFRLYNHVTKHIRKKDVLIVVSADHGIGSCPEDMKKLGYTNAHRIIADDLVAQLNDTVYKTFGIKNMLLGIKVPSLFFNTHKLHSLSPEKQELILETCKKQLLAQPGISNVWTPQELRALSAPESSIIQYFKNQLYDARIGQLLIQTDPYCLLAKKDQQYSHRSPYNYDTHIPLIFYQSGSHERAQWYNRVTSLQCAPTLAYLLGIQKPAAALQSLLPGITPTNDPQF